MDGMDGSGDELAVFDDLLCLHGFIGSCHEISWQGTTVVCILVETHRDEVCLVWSALVDVNGDMSLCAIGLIIHRRYFHTC